MASVWETAQEVLSQSHSQLWVFAMIIQERNWISESPKLQEESLGFSSLFAAYYFIPVFPSLRTSIKGRNLFGSKLESKNRDKAWRLSWALLRKISLLHHWKLGAYKELGMLLSARLRVFHSRKRWSHSLLVKSKEKTGEQGGFSAWMKGSKSALVTNAITFSALLSFVGRKK